MTGSPVEGVGADGPAGTQPPAQKRGSTMKANQDELEERQEATQKTRRCLLCGRSFLSEWAGERVCRNCKSTEAWRRG